MNLAEKKAATALHLGLIEACTMLSARIHVSPDELLEDVLNGVLPLVAADLGHGTDISFDESWEKMVQRFEGNESKEAQESNRYTKATATQPTPAEFAPLRQL